MSIQQSTELVIFVTHVEAENSFLKIWGQVDKNSATCVERMILPLVEQFARSQGCVGSQSANLRINALCCARFQNEGYYRAKVINIRADSMVVLQFIDYGNIEVLPPQEIHLLESIPGSESLQSFPPVAFDFTLMHVLPINGIWENNIIESIKKTLWYNEYKILIHTVVNNHRFIKLWYNNEDFSELLINKHMAMRATLQEMFRPKCIQQSQVPIYQPPNKRLISNNCTTMTSLQNMDTLHDGNEMHGFQRNVPLCCAVQQKHMMQTSIQEALVFKSRVLDVPSKHDVYVSFVEDGPHKFSVQLQSTSQILSMLMREINSHPIEPLQEPPLPGSVCLGRYTQDKVLCRAVVMSVMENKCKLYYVDFGHTEVLPYTDIFQLPPHFINPRVLSIRFTLSGVHELNVTDKMKEYFKQIVSGKLLVLHVRPPEGPPLVQYGDLYDDGKNIKDILRQAFPTSVIVTSISSSFAYQKPKKLSKGVVEIVLVSFVESFRKFFVQVEDYITSLELTMNNLADFCKTAPTLSLTQLKIGLPCAALYDNQWYRAQILGINGDNIKVLYVDYGNEETVSLTSLRLIRDDLIKKLPAQAIKCALNGWELLPCTQEIHNQFELLILEKRLRLRVLDVNLDGIIVDLYGAEQNDNIKSQMLDIIKNQEKIINEPLNYQDAESQHSTKMTSKIDQSEDKWHKRNQSDSWHQEKNKFKTWKDESNEEKIQENKNEKSSFHRNDVRNERFNRDDFSNNRNTKDKWNNRHEHNDSFKNGKSTRGGRNRTSGYIPKNSSDKSWSDKDSDTSSRGSSRRGRSNNTRGCYSRRENISGKLQNNKFNDRNNDGSFKGGKTNSDSYHGNRDRFKEKKGQGYRLTQNKLNDNFASDEEGRKYSPMRNKNEFYIPCPRIIIGATRICEVVFINNLSDFFIQLHSDYVALDSIMDNIASIYEIGGELMKESDILNGTYCIAQYSEDLKWYRAVIKSTIKNNAIVQFIDYGNTETVKFDKIKSIQKEFLKLPIQAVHCKLFGVKDNLDKDKIKNFEDAVIGKTLKAEFINEENGIYNILLKENIDNCSTNTFINQKFCENIDLPKAKEDKISNKIFISSIRQFNEPDYVSLDAVWNTVLYTPETKKDVIITWFTNPNNFYCQILDKENQFRIMMNQIQKIYVGREPVSHTLQVGSPIIARFSDDGALYRAEVIELNKLNGHLIQYIDFGNNAVVNPRKIYPVEKNLMYLPKQAVQCSLLNIAPLDGISWSKVNTKAIDNCFNADKYKCIFHDIKNNKYSISLINEETDVGNMLVEQNLASFNSKIKSHITEDKNSLKSTISCDIERMDINLLNGQTLRVNVSSVENASKFYIQIPSATECEKIINNYMADKNPEVMQRLSTHEICLGTGCLVYSNGIWRRAVISNHSQSTGFNVKFIDTGAYDEIFSDSVLALPGELSVMQNQAVECSLVNTISIPERDITLKDLIEGKEVIIYVDEIDDNRLIVKLFDLNGNKINISGDIDEKISPICPMPILSSTHKVSVSYADHSASIWLQRNAEYNLDKNLVEALDQYYSTSGKLLEPKVDLLCAVKSVDGHWYRAKIIKCTENGVYVNFIDYGNNEEVTSCVVMVLDSHFYIPHQLAINVSLPVTLNGTITEQLNILQNYLSNKELTAVFHNLNKKWTVELLYNGEKISDKFRSLNSESQQGISEMKKPQIHNITMGCKYNVCVSHVDSPSQFWLQLVDDATNLSNKQKQLQIQAPTFSEIDGILEEGSLCVAVYTIDNLWYRAQVLDADEDITTVRFIDYGNTDVIDNKSGNIRQIPDSWKEIEEYAIKCRLDIIPIESEDWNITTCEKFENLISVESLQAIVVANSVPKRIDLLINDKSVSESLVEDHHAIKIHTEEELIDEIIDLELDPHSAFVSHINSPNEFWVQEEKSVGDLEIMTDRFIVAHMFAKVDEIKENLLCVAKYPEDECWYRARVISHSDNATRVIYIDYGNSATSTEIRAIPADLAEIPPLSRKCCLVMPEEITEWSEKACEEFIALAADGATIFLLDVIKEDETSLVKLTLDDKNVTDILANFCQRYPSIIEERLPPLGEENSPNVFISRINTPDEFWIQTESNITDLNMMIDRLKAASTFLPLNTFEIGTICAANYSEDNQWYRAKILSHSENGTEVLYIDYGNTAITNETRMLPVDIINIPPLAKRCTLQKPDIINFWPLDAYKTFENLAASGETMFQFEILDNTSDPVCIKLIYNEKNIVDILVPFSKNISKDGLESKEELYKDKNANEMKNNNEEKILKTEEINEISKENIDINKFQENIESQNQEIEKNNLCLSTSIIELSVDEIVQNMKMDEPEEDEDMFNTHNNIIESCHENNNDKLKNDLKHLKPQVEIQICNKENEMQDIQNNTESNKMHDEIKIMNEEILSNTKDNIETILNSPNIKNVENLETQQNNIIPETQICNNEIRIYESNIQNHCKNPNNENTLESEKFVKIQHTKTLEKNGTNKSSISFRKEESLCIDEEEKSNAETLQNINEINVNITDFKDKIISSEIQLSNCEIGIHESNINIQCCGNSNNENTLQSAEEFAKVQYTETLEKSGTNKSSISFRKEESLCIDEEEKSNAENNKTLQNINEINVNITNFKDKMISSEIQLSNCEIGIHESNINIQCCESSNNGKTLQSAEAQEKNITNNSSISFLKAETNISNIDEKKCNIESKNNNEINVNIINSENFEVKDTDEKIFSDLQSTEVKNNEFKIIDEQDRIPLIVTTVTISENVNENNDITNSSQFESASTTSE
ncbi:maternal protein tudor isoform X1 [Apis cerana]|uniref:maternal protein tudor isoform X1 n=1 Tax=Apis cerana TaxID=7461 RepID=UPI002B2276F9|nr:maternal protein tudor isoform X1 [Apis cerana]XP_061943075.1 maternal protein tudor isoform X1 [Apis cerana]